MKKLLIFLAILICIRAQLRLCEAEGSCRHCQDNRYSYYRCRMQDDCFIGEICDSGFCCPNVAPTFSLQREPSNNTKEETCPDGGKFDKKCSKKEDCSLMKNELCIEGKCCKSCGARRREFLDSLQSTSEIIGQPIPKCTENGEKYAKKQCLAATETCWCVNENGKRIKKEGEKECETVRRKQENMAIKAVKILENRKKCKEDEDEEDEGKCPILRDGISKQKRECDCDYECSKGFKCCPTVTNTFNICLPAINTQKLTPALSLVCGTNEQYSSCYSVCQPSCQDPSTPPCPIPNCQPGCICLPGYIRRDGSPRSACVPRGLCQAYDLTIQCADPRRQYQTCGSACPINCSNRNEPKCSNEKCVTGCFCKVPYILENADDPLHSRCILPSECSSSSSFLLSPTMDIAQQFIARNPSFSSSSSSSYPTSPLPISNHCSDPLKNYLNCGSSCPASCDRPLSQSTSLECALSCVTGCFCRLPYVLLDSKNASSTCILPQLCPRKSIPPQIIATQNESCLDPRKEWSQCEAKQCSRSCLNPTGRCSSSQCISGCICRSPYLLLDSSDSSSRCVLPSECLNSCQDPNKQYIQCGSSCPIGCDNRHPKNCAPCQTGCFCKNGWVFEKSSTWTTSKCVKLEECPEMDTSTTPMITTTTTTTSTTSTTTIPLTTTTKIKEEFSKEDNFGLAIAKNTGDSLVASTISASASACPETTFDVGGRGCNSDIDCPIEQRCCRPMIVSLGVNPQRCVCPDKHAVWSSCGTLCPEYCGQPSIPVCSSTCNAGCHCAPGFIRSRNDVGAPCVPRDSCSFISTQQQQQSFSADDQPIRFATIREILPQDPIIEHVIAVALLNSRDNNQPLGKFTFSQITANTLKINGNIQLANRQRYAVVLHRFGDSSEHCSKVGVPFSKSSTPSIGDLDENGKLERIIDWPINDVIGRSIVIYPFSTSEWNSRAHFGERPLACGTIGIAKLVV